MINKELEFYSLIDFYVKRNTIKENFDLLTLDERILYKMYVYSIPFEDEYGKDLMWEFLNDYSIQAWSNLAIRYRTIMEKNEKRQQQYDKESNEHLESAFWLIINNMVI